MSRRLITLFIGFTFLLSLALMPALPKQRVLVGGQSVDHAAASVVAVGGEVERRLNVVDGVIASVTAPQLAALQNRGLMVAIDSKASVANAVSSSPDVGSIDGGDAAVYPSTALGVGELHADGVTGKGVTVAVVDSGMPFMPNLNKGNGGRPAGAPNDGSLFYKTKGGQFIVYRDFLPNGDKSHSSDPYGHGTHVAGTIADGALKGTTLSSGWRGVAPEANLVVARAMGVDGIGNYSDIIAAIDWIVSVKDVYDIRVLNLSMYGLVGSPYWADMLNRAVMNAWEEGLVVVASAGNTGPNPLTVGVPGNNPYVITVGAVRSAAISESGDDELADFSSRGPTESRFVKPDVLAPGARIVAPLPSDSYLATQAAQRGYLSAGQVKLAGNKSQVSLYRLSGTSMAAAEVSGLVALLLQERPELNNDQVKWLLRRTTNVAIDPQTEMPAYSIWEQGWGKVNAGYLFEYDGAVLEANQDMDIALDQINGPGGVHYMGYTNYNPDTTTFFIDEPELAGNPYFSWNGASQTWTGQTWTGQTWTGQTWTGQTWTGQTWTGQVWSGQTWTGQSWSGNTWLGQQWTGQSWTGQQWTGQGWTGQGWTGQSWSGQSWTGQGWTGQGWTGQSWTGQSWSGQSWNGQSWNGQSWTSQIWSGVLGEETD